MTQYEEALQQVQSLEPADQERLLRYMAARLQHPHESSLSILQLQGLGKEVWSKLDAQEYVNRERASWDG